MAQLDRATVCGTVGRRFESCWARFFPFLRLNRERRLKLENN